MTTLDRDEAAARPVDGEDRRRPGRPREEALDERILAATLELIDRDEPVTVSRVVEVSGVSRAAIYRRWPSMAELVAAALDTGRTVVAIPVGADLRASIREGVFGAADRARATYSDRRFRQRMRLTLADRALQKVYWRGHVTRRRASLAAALQAGVERGELRADLDVEAAIDLLNGVFYYQGVVRGERFDDPGVFERCEVAFDIAWRGMLAERSSNVA